MSEKSQKIIDETYIRLKEIADDETFKGTELYDCWVREALGSLYKEAFQHGKTFQQQKIIGILRLDG